MSNTMRVTADPQLNALLKGIKEVQGCLSGLPRTPECGIIIAHAEESLVAMRTIVAEIAFDEVLRMLPDPTPEGYNTEMVQREDDLEVCVSYTPAVPAVG